MSVSVNAGITGVQTLTVNVSDAASQTASAQVSLTINAPPVVSIGASAPGLGCGITSITLTANVSVGATYNWDDGSSTPTRTISASGTYGLSATATNGCSATATSLTIGQGGNNANITVTLVFNSSATVMGTGVPTITVPNRPGQVFQVFGGTGSSFSRQMVLDRIQGYLISEEDYSSTGVFPIKRPSPFSITVRDGSGCTRTVQGEIVMR